MSEPDFEARTEFLRSTGGIRSKPAAEAAVNRGVEVTPVNEYCVGKATPEALQLGFAAVDRKEIRRGVQELAIALEGVR